VAAHEAVPVSENVTSWPVTGAAGENENSAFGGAAVAVGVGVAVAVAVGVGAAVALGVGVAVAVAVGVAVGVGVAIVNVRVAGLAPTLPAASVARTLNVYTPSARLGYVRGLEHAANEPVALPGPSSRHSKFTPVSSAENVNDADESVDCPDGPDRIDATGARVSIVTVRGDDVGDMFPAASVLVAL
jgi:hypothetical protein